MPYRELAEAGPGEGSAAIRGRVHAAHAAQLARFAGRRLFCNAPMSTADLRAAAIDGAAGQLLECAMHSLALSARAYTASSRSPAQSPIPPARRRSPPPTSPRRCSTAPSDAR